MAKILTRDLTRAALDWAVAIAEGIGPNVVGGHVGAHIWHDTQRPFDPSTDWAQGGPIIEREGITTSCAGADETLGESRWTAWYPDTSIDETFEGSTPLVAAMRCYVASKLGDEIEVPASD